MWRGTAPSQTPRPLELRPPNLELALMPLVTLQESDDDYAPVSRSPRGRGRGRGAGRGSTPRRKEHVAVEEGQLQSDDDIVTVNSVKLGKRFPLLFSLKCVCK